MSDGIPPELPPPPQQPDEKKSGSKGYVNAMLLGFIIAGLIYHVVSGGLEGWIEAAPVHFYFAVIAISLLWPILLMLVVVIGGVWLGCKMTYKPPIAPQPLPRTQSEESSNQEEEKIQPGKEN